MSSFSEGMLAGYRVGMGIKEFNAKQQQQQVDNGFRDRIIAINEGREGRQQSMFDFGNNTETLEGIFEELNTSGDSGFSMDTYVKDIEQGGHVEALRRTLVNQFGGDFGRMMSDPNGQQVALHQLNNSPSFKNRIEDGTNIHADALVPLQHPETGQRGFAIRTVNPQGQVGGISRNRAVGEQDLVFIPEENLAMMMFEGLREQGAFSSPEAIQQFEEMGFDYEASVAAMEGSSPLDVIPKATKLEAVVKEKKRPTISEEKPKLNDGKESRKQATADPTKQQESAKSIYRDLEANRNSLTPDDVAFMEQRIADENADLGALEDTFLNRATDSVVDTVARDIPNFGREVADNIETRGLFPAISRSELAQSSVGGAVDLVNDVKGLFSKAGTFLFGPDVFNQAESEGATPSEESKKADREITQDMASNDPVKRADAEARIEQQVAQATPQQRVSVGASDLSAFYNRRSRNSKPTPRQMAQATRLRTNGLISENALATYLETGKFTLDDMKLAAMENQARARAVKNRTDYLKLQNDIGQQRAEQLKSEFDVNLNAASTAFAQHFSHNANADKILERSGVDAPEFSESILNGIYTHPRIISAFTRGQGRYSYQLTGEDMSRIARYTAEILNQNMVRGEDNWFSRDVEQQLPFTDQLVSDIIAGLAKDEQQLQN